MWMARSLKRNAVHPATAGHGAFDAMISVISRFFTFGLS